MKAAIHVTLLLTVLSGTVGCSPDKLSAREGQGLETGQQILTAIYQYHADHGEYPASLADLTPDYYAAPIAQGNRRSEWTYWPPQTDDVQMMTLSWGRGRQSRLIYVDMGQKRGWSKMVEGGTSFSVTARDVKSAVETERQSQQGGRTLRR